MNEPEPLQQIGRTSVLYRKRKLSYFGGCDYFRLASHPEVLRAVTIGLKKYGLNVAASRMTTGNHFLYRKLETALAGFFGAPAALLVSNGYAANAVAAQALRDDFSHVLIDARAHASLRDASRLFSCPVWEFKHRDLADLRRVLAAAGRSAKPILLTDGVFTYEGEIAPLPEYLKILGGRGTVLVDDAHGAGVLGRAGRGTLELTGVLRERIIQTVTLSKAFGVYGGAILCSRPLRSKMIDKSAMFAGGTPLPLPLAHAAWRAVRVLQKDRSLRRRLHENARYIKSGLRAAGFAVPLMPVPVVSITPKNARETAAMRRGLMANGIFPSHIRYPGGPAGGYFRFAISSEHSRKQLDALLAGCQRSSFLVRDGSQPRVRHEG